jgi:DNA-binding LacI/PurR family transcriptional regulator
MHGALRALRDAGVKVGRELSFVGCDDVAVAEFHVPPIAMVRRVPRDAGTAAAQMLLSLVAGDEVTEDVLLPTWFVASPSCAAPPW